MFFVKAASLAVAIYANCMSLVLCVIGNRVLMEARVRQTRHRRIRSINALVFLVIADRVVRQVRIEDFNVTNTQMFAALPCILTPPCKNGGTCNQNVLTGAYNCSCASGYAGTNCSVGM
jgi:hypothetical protein